MFEYECLPHTMTRIHLLNGGVSGMTKRGKKVVAHSLVSKDSMVRTDCNHVVSVGKTD